MNKFYLVSLTVIINLLSVNSSLFSQSNPENLLLKNYRPKSLYKVPETIINKAKYSVIDIHSHAFISSEKELDKWVGIMDSFGIEKTVILTKSYGREFDSLITIFSKYPDKFILFCGFDYNGYENSGYGPDAVKELERCYKEGARGVGELGDKGKGLFYCKPPAWGMHIDDPRMDLLLEKCANLGMPVSIHVGEPQWFYENMDSTNDGLMTAYDWRLDNQKNILTLDEELKTLENAASKHPRTIFIACHYANQVTDLYKLGKLLNKYPNLYADIAARLAEVSSVPRYTKEFMEKYSDRILYGTDNDPDREMYEMTFRILESNDEHFYNFDYGYHWPLYGLGLSGTALKKLYYDNAVRIVKIK